MVGFCAAKIEKRCQPPIQSPRGVFVTPAAHPIFVRGFCREMKRGVNERGDASTADEPYRLFSLDHESLRGETYVP